LTWTAFLDACVLYPVATRDILLRGAERYLYQIRWSELVLDEVKRGLLRDGRCTPHQADYLIRQMRVAFPEAMVGGYEHLIDTMTNEQSDRHVLAAAVAAGADVLVSDNPRHFPLQSRREYGIAVQTADQFLSLAFDLAPASMRQIFAEQVEDFRRPRFDAIAALVRLEERLPMFAARLRSPTR
jgi:hypothetical protein